MKTTFSASLDYLHDMLHFIRHEAQAAGFEGLYETQIELALEEALVNIIKHGYRLYPGEIDIETIPLEHGIAFILADRGIPYNPCESFFPSEIPDQQESHGAGGYGIYLIRAIMNQVEYTHREGCNILTLTKIRRPDLTG